MTPVPLGDMPQVEGLFGRIEKWTLVLLLFFLISFSLLQIALRNFFSTGFIWGDSLLRHCVLWISLLGAARATAENKHIRIDLLPRLLPRAGAVWISIVVDCFSFLVCLVLLYASLSFVNYERMANTFAFAEIPLWWLEAIFPFSFGVMTIRFGARITSSGARIVHGTGGSRP